MNEEQTTLTDQPRSQFHLEHTRAIRNTERYQNFAQLSSLLKTARGD